VLVRIPQGVCHNDEFVSALHLMADKDVGALIVLEGSKLVGIFSERDYARKVRLAGKTSTDTPVSKIMTEKVVSVTLAEPFPSACN
jgi:CBS domain-containing protein